jgi:hypothetical protein
MADDSTPSDEEIRSMLRAPVDVSADTRRRHIAAALDTHTVAEGGDHQSQPVAPDLASVTPIRRRGWRVAGAVAAAVVLVAGVGGVLVTTQTSRTADTVASDAQSTAEPETVESPTADSSTGDPFSGNTEAFGIDGAVGEQFIGEFATEGDLVIALRVKSAENSADPLSRSQTGSVAEAPTAAAGAGGELDSDVALDDAQTEALATGCAGPIGPVGQPTTSVGRAMVGGTLVEVFVIVDSTEIDSTAAILVDLPGCLVRR